MTPTLDTVAAKPETIRALAPEARFALGQQALSVAWLCLFSVLEDGRQVHEDAGKLLTIKEAAPRLGFSPGTLYTKWRRDPRLKALTVNNGTDRVLFDPAKVRAYQQKRGRR